MDARPWTQPFAAPLPPPDAFLHLRLRVADAWLAEDAEWRPIADEPRPACGRSSAISGGTHPRLMTRDPEAAAFAEADAYLGLGGRSSWRSMRSLARRGEIAEGTGAGVCLRAIGDRTVGAAGHSSRRRASGR